MTTAEMVSMLSRIQKKAAKTHALMGRAGFRITDAQRGICTRNQEQIINLITEILAGVQDGLTTE